jgi:hypothetical protein
MKKDIIESFIEKYNLGGTIESVKWVSDGATSTLKTSFLSQEKTAAGVLILNNFKMGDAEIGVHDTAKLKSLLSVLGTDIDVDLQKHGDKFISMKISDDSTFVNFMLADLSVIPNSAPAVKKLPDFNLVIPFDKVFSSRFISSKSALPDVDVFTILENKKKKLELVLGHSSINSNRITLGITPETGKDKLPKPISFSAKYLKEILSANNEDDSTESKLYVSSAGLAKISFESDNFKVDYYLVEVETQD